MNRERKVFASLLFIVLIALQVSALTDADYKEALKISTRFFGAQRCGDTANSWIGHDRCHWFDGDDNNVDLTGGWHDCGDHPKFAQTGGYAAMVLLHGYVSFKSSYPDNYGPKHSAGGPNGIPDVLDEAKYYTDYALKMLKGDDFYYQVGTAIDDHKSCSTPDYQSENEPDSGGENSRPSYKVTGGGASNIAGIHSAVLSLMYLAYKEYDEAYANKCKDMAIKLYEFGDKKHEAVSSTGGKAPYADDTWADDMALAAALLRRVTGETSYSTAARGFMGHDNFNDLPTYFVLDYPVVSPIVQYEMGKHVMKKTNYKTPLALEVDVHLDSMIDLGFAFFGYADSSWGSMKYASAAAYSAMLAYDLFPDKTQYRDFAKANIDFMLGAHGKVSNDIPSGFSFLVGFGDNYPSDHVHHAGSFGGEPGRFGTSPGYWGDWNTKNKHELTGALVGGPTTKEGGYQNYRNNPYTNEVCIYYNAPLVSALAKMVHQPIVDPIAPSDIKLSNSTVYSDKADAKVGSITVVDENAEDTHTLTLTSGGDKFSISGTSLVTKEGLAIGDYTVKIKATDPKDLSYEKEFTIKVIEEPEGPENLSGWLGWYTYVDTYGSTVDTSDSGILVNDTIAKATFNMKTTEGDKYVSGGLGARFFRDTIGKVNGEMEYDTTFLVEPKFIVIEYKSDQTFNFVVPTKEIDPNSGQSYYKELPAASSWTLDTVYLNMTDLKQPSWVDADKKKDFNKNTACGFDLSAPFEGKSGTIEVRMLQVDGFVHQDVPVTKTVVNSQAQFKVNSVSPKMINLTVPAAGYYTLEVYSLNGRSLGSIVSRLTEGANNVRFMDADYFGSNVVIFRIKGNGAALTQRLVLQ